MLNDVLYQFKNENHFVFIKKKNLYCSFSAEVIIWCIKCTVDHVSMQPKSFLKATS